MSTDLKTGNRPDDHDYEFCQRYGIPTIDAQRRAALAPKPHSDVSSTYPFAGGGMASSLGD